MPTTSTTKILSVFIMFHIEEGLASLGRRSSVGEQSQAGDIQEEEATVASFCIHTAQSSLNTGPCTGRRSLTHMVRGFASSHGSEALVPVMAEPGSSVHSELSDISHSGLLFLMEVGSESLWLHPTSCLISLLPLHA